MENLWLATRAIHALYRGGDRIDELVGAMLVAGPLMLKQPKIRKR